MSRLRFALTAAVYAFRKAWRVFPAFFRRESTSLWAADFAMSTRAVPMDPCGCPDCVAERLRSAPPEAGPN